MKRIGNIAMSVRGETGSTPKAVTSVDILAQSRRVRGCETTPGGKLRYLAEQHSPREQSMRTNLCGGKIGVSVNSDWKRWFGVEQLPMVRRRVSVLLHAEECVEMLTKEDASHESERMDKGRWKDHGNLLSLQSVFTTDQQLLDLRKNINLINQDLSHKTSSISEHDDDLIKQDAPTSCLQHRRTTSAKSPSLVYVVLKLPLRIQLTPSGFWTSRLTHPLLTPEHRQTFSNHSHPP